MPRSLLTNLAFACSSSSSCFLPVTVVVSTSLLFVFVVVASSGSSSCSLCRCCAHHVAAAFSMPSFRSAHRRCLPIVLVGRRCRSCGRCWPSPGCTAHVQNSQARVFDGRGAVGWGRGGRP